MIQHTSTLDSSALFEKQLAAQLFNVAPYADLTRVDLKPFKPLRAKVDCIKISRPNEISPSLMSEMKAQVATRLKLSANPIGEAFIAVQDPTLNDLRFLIKHFPKSHILHFEIAVDAFLPDGSNDLYLLRQLKEQIRHSLAPHAHPQFLTTTRKRWDLGAQRWSHDSAKKPAPLTTVHYVDKWTRTCLKIYIKTLDQRRLVKQPWLRTELTFSPATPDWAGIDRMEDLHGFSSKLRKYCSSAFNIGCRFKNGDEDGSKWSKYGAAWSFKENKGMKVAPDAAVNRAFGDALNDLGRSLKRL